MAKFVFLYRGGSMPQSEAEMAEVMKDWENWYTGLGKAVVDPGNPFTPQERSIRSNGGIKDQSLNATASGYTIVEADSMDAAASMAKTCPVLKSGADISVFETFNVI